MSDDNQQIPVEEISAGQLSRQALFEGQREQGGCLTSILIIFTIFAFSNIFSDFMLLIHPISTLDRSIFTFISFTSNIVNLISISGIWKWKKWGVKLLVISYIFGELFVIIAAIIRHTYNITFQNPFFMTSALAALTAFILIFLFFYLEVKKGGNTLANGIEGSFWLLAPE